MQTAIKDAYRAQREPWHSVCGQSGRTRSTDAIRWARAKAARDVSGIADEFERLESADLVRVRIEPDDDYRFDFEDCCSPSDFDGGQRTFDACQKSEREVIERDGVWGIVSEFRRPACSACGCAPRWEVVESCWGFVGDVDAASMEEFKDAAVTAYKESTK